MFRLEALKWYIICQACYLIWGPKPIISLRNSFDFYWFLKFTKFPGNLSLILWEQVSFHLLINVICDVFHEYRQLTKSTQYFCNNCLIKLLNYTQSCHELRVTSWPALNSSWHFDHVICWWNSGSWRKQEVQDMLHLSNFVHPKLSWIFSKFLPKLMFMCNFLKWIMLYSQTCLPRKIMLITFNKNLYVILDPIEGCVMHWNGSFGKFLLLVLPLSSLH